MKPLFHLLAISITLLSSCSSGHPPIHLPENFPDTIPTQVYDPFQPDSICLFTREKTGSIIGEWVEVGVVTGGIISEPDCVTLDTTGFATHWEGNWIFKNDSVVLTYGHNVEFKNDSIDHIISGNYAQPWKYEMRGVNDTILMVDESHDWHDTLRITRLAGDTMILASYRYLYAFRPAVKKSVVYIRRK